MARKNDRLYIPTVYEILFYTLLGTLLLVLTVIFSTARDYDVRNYNFFSTTAKHFIDTRLDFMDSPHWATIITFLLWMICGILTYIAIWFTATVFIAYKEDRIPLHGFLTPRGYSRSDELFTAMARGLIRFVALLLSLVWLIMLIRNVIPYLAKVFASGLSPFTFATIPTLFAASLMLGVSFYAMVVLVRFMFLRKRILSREILE